MSGALRDYLEKISRSEHETHAALRERTAALPVVGVMLASPVVGQLLQFLVRALMARNVIEIGVFTGYSTLAMAMAICRRGQIVAMDVSEKWAEIGKKYWEQAGCSDRIDLRIGPANDTLDSLIEGSRAGTFDLAFIDANKDGYWGYFERCLVLLRQNGIMIFDNTLFDGRVLPDYTEEHIRREAPIRPKSMQDVYVAYTEGLRRFNELIARDERVDVVVLPMIDGVTLARKR